MHKRRLLIAFFCSLLLLAVLHHIALQFFLYWTYRWLDIPMHLLGGAVVALGYHALLSFHGGTSWGRAVPTMLAVLAVGVGWEVFELAFDLSVADSYVADTALDLVMDLVGGVVVLALMRFSGSAPHHT